MLRYPGKLAIQRRALTPYRAAFFDALAQACDCGLSIFAGLPSPEESIVTTGTLYVARFATARNLNLLRDPFYLCFQRGLLNWLADWDSDVFMVETN